MITNADGYFITRAEMDLLADKLGTVPILELEMILALSSQARISDGPTTSRPKPHSKPPYPMHLEDEIDQLRNELTTTARDICETRGLEYEGGTSCTSVSRWLIRYRVALALMPQAPDLFDGILKRIDHCARTMNQVQAEYIIDHTRLAHANRQVMTGVQIEKLAHKLGEECKGLTRKRIDALRNRHGLEGTRDPETQVWFYKLGDVIAAHKDAKQYRPRKSA